MKIIGHQFIHTMSYEIIFVNITKRSDYEPVPIRIKRGLPTLKTLKRKKLERDLSYLDIATLSTLKANIIDINRCKMLIINAIDCLHYFIDIIYNIKA